MQQQIFSAADDGVFTLASRADGRFDAINMRSVDGSASVGGVSLSEAFAQWPGNQSSTGNDRGYWKHYRRYVWVQLDGPEQRGSHNSDGRPDPSYAVIENLSLSRVPMAMENPPLGVEVVFRECQSLSRHVCQLPTNTVNS